MLGISPDIGSGGHTSVVVADPSLPPFAVSGTDLADGVLVRIVASNERVLLARINRPTCSQYETGIIRFGAEQRHELRVRVGDTVTVEEVELPPLRQLTVVPTFPVHLQSSSEEAVVNFLAAAGAPLRAGSRFRAPCGRSGSSSGVFLVTDLALPNGSTDLALPNGSEGVVDSVTKVLVRAPTLAEIAELSADVALLDVGGMHQVLPRLREAIEIPLTTPSLYRELGIVPPRGVLMYGPPGAGKTYVARALAAELGISFEYVNGPEIVSGSYGKTESNLRHLFEEAVANAPTLVMIDEIDSLAPNRAHLGAQADYRMVTQLLTLLDSLQHVDSVVVLGTTNRPDSIDPAMRRPGRLDIEIFVGPPSRAERQEILQVYVDRMPLTPSARDHVAVVAEVTHGYLPADLMAVARQAGLNALRRHIRSGIGLSAPTVDVHDLDSAAANVRPTLLRGTMVTLPQVTLDDLVGMDDVRRQLWALVEHAKVDGESEIILLSGPRACGKTSFAHAYANAVEAHLLEISPADLFTSWLGETEETIRSLFQLASFVAPTVITLENLGGVAPSSPDIGAAPRRAVNQLLRELDRLPPGVHVVGTTDSPETIDPVVLRRFHLIELPQPSASDRLELVRRRRPNLEDDAIEDFVRDNEGMDFAQLSRALP